MEIVRERVEVESPTRIMTWTLYIVECSDGTLYAGVTSNLEKRLRNHNSRKGGRYTKGRAPVILKHTEEHRTKSKAMKREQQIKGWTRAKKMALMQGDAERLRSLSQRKT